MEKKKHNFIGDINLRKGKKEKIERFLGKIFLIVAHPSFQIIQNKVFYVFMRKHDNFTMREVKLKCNVTHQKFPNLSKNIKIIVKRN